MPQSLLEADIFYLGKFFEEWKMPRRTIWEELLE